MRLRQDAEHGDVLEEITLLSFRLSNRESSRFNSPNQRLRESKMINYPNLEFNENTYLDDGEISSLNQNMGKIQNFNKKH